MILAIIIGQVHTYINSWEDNSGLPVIKDYRPGIGAYMPASDTAGKDDILEWLWNPSLSALDQSAVIKTCLEDIIHSHPVIGESSIEALVIDIPFFSNLKLRSLLLAAAAEICPAQNTSIIPHPLAIAAGCRQSHDISPCQDMAIIADGPGESLDMSLVSILPSSLVLEKQLLLAGDTCGQPFNNLMEAWQPAHTFYVGQNWRCRQDLLQSGPTRLTVVSPPQASELAMAGIQEWLNIKPGKAGSKWELLYPHDFYIASANRTDSWYKINFDTANLPLAVDGLYPIGRLGSCWSEPGRQEKAVLDIYEIPGGCPAQRSPWFHHQLALPVPAADPLLDQAVIVLDMKTAGLRLDLPAHIGQTFPHCHLNPRSQSILENLIPLNRDKLLAKLNHILEFWEKK